MQHSHCKSRRRQEETPNEQRFRSMPRETFANHETDFPQRLANTISPLRMKINYAIQVWREGKQFIAHAMPIDVASSGRTPREARLALNEAVRLFVRSAEEMGTIKEILGEAGYKC